MVNNSPQALDKHAGHIRYEVASLVGQVDAISNQYGCATPERFDGPRDDALLEASLVHLRLLDDFLQSKGWDTDIKANMWVPMWLNKPWLDGEVRERINWQVAHLSMRRMDRNEWNLCAIAGNCCGELVRFFQAVQQLNDGNDRIAAFGNAPGRALYGNSEFTMRIEGE